VTAVSRRPILVVEDNDDDLTLALRALREHDVRHEVALARDGVEASEFLFGDRDGDDEGADARHPLPVVVILDLNLPRVNGLEVLRRIRAHERTRLLPVVVLTSSRADEDIVSSYSMGANSYVRKPVDYATFRDAMRALGDYWLSLNEMPPDGGSR
jgi:two-component system, response regulator